ncbi:unnamed protein product [Prunus armeniaca]
MARHGQGLARARIKHDMSPCLLQGRPKSDWRRLWETTQKAMSFSFSSALGTLEQVLLGIGLQYPSIIRHVRCLHISPMIRNRPSAFGLRHPSIIRRVRCLHIPQMIWNRPSAFGPHPSAFGHQPSAPFDHSARAMPSHPPNDSASTFGTS